MKTGIKTGLSLLAACFLLFTAPAVAQTYIRDVNYNENDITANEEVKCITELQYQTVAANNGKKIIGGSFSYYDGVYSSFIARVNQDGTIDKTFKSPGAFNGSVFCVTEGRDGKLYVGGAFTKIGNKTIRGIVRLNSDGSIDNTFDTKGGFNGNSWEGATPEVWSILVKDDPVLDATDAGILVGGDIKRFNGNLIEGPNDEGGLVQLNFDGSLNRSFRVTDDCCTGGPVYDMAFDNNGQIVIGGEFGKVDGITCRRLARLNRKGGYMSTPILDPTFARITFPESSVYVVTIQPDNKILVGGAFSSFLNYSWATVAGTGRYIARLNADGTLDLPGDADADEDFIIGAGFTAPGGITYPGVRAIAVDEAGRILVGGDLNSYNGFDSYDGRPINNMVRLNSNGTIDASFNIGTGFNSSVLAIIIRPETYNDHDMVHADPSTYILVAGKFTAFNGSSSQGSYAKLGKSTALATADLHFKATQLPGNGVKLQWQDVNAQSYELQRSADGVHFKTIYTTAHKAVAAGFSYIDKPWNTPTLYYRLVYKDAAGNQQVSAVQKISFSSIPDVMLYAASGQELKLRYAAQGQAVSKLVIQAVALSGKVLFQRELPVQSGRVQTTVYLTSPLETCFLLVKDADGSILYKGYWSPVK